MNQVMEMLRLAPGASESDAVARLSTLFDIMRRANGFRDAEVLRSVDDAGLLLVLHTWDGIEDWHTFRKSETKMAFSASRPAFLYNFEPCGMNWQLVAAETSAEDAPFLHRQVVKAHLSPLAGPSVASSQTFTYQDYEPTLEGAMLRLTRSYAVPVEPRLTGEDVLSDDVYESVRRLVATPQPTFEFAG